MDMNATVRGVVSDKPLTEVEWIATYGPGKPAEA
jgi:hypothetical protein